MRLDCTNLIKPTRNVIYRIFPFVPILREQKLLSYFILLPLSLGETCKHCLPNPFFVSVSLIKKSNAQTIVFGKQRWPVFPEPVSRLIASLWKVPLKSRKTLNLPKTLHVICRNSKE